MSIEIKEYIGSDFNIKESLSRQINLAEGYSNADPISEDSIMQDIEGIHVGPTINYTWYTEEALDYSIPTWTKPYQRPLIMHHNETDGKIIGRIMHVEKLTKNTRSGTPALMFTCNVPDKDGKEQILDGRLKTVSIGVIAHDVRCSICGKQVELDECGYPECGHVRGNVYDGDKVCYWMIYKMEAKELSYVIVPSDVYAHNIRTYKPNKKKVRIQENLKEGVMKTMEIEKTNNELEVKEGQVVEEEVKETAAAETVSEVKAEENKEEVKANEEVKEDSKVNELEDKVKALEAEKIETAKKLEELQVELSKAQAKADELVKELETEVKLKESVENELVDAKKAIRESMEENLTTLRSVLNKPVLAKEALSTRSDESIKDSILDLKEELFGLTTVKNITEAVDPTLKTEEKIQEKNKVVVNESKTAGNINLEEAMQDLMASFLK